MIIIITSFIILLSVIFTIRNIFIIPWILIFVLSFFSTKPLVPEITYGEFPFRLVYSINGEKITVEDIFIAEFDGFGWNIGVEGYRRWRGHIKGTGKTRVLVLIDDNRRIYITVGSARYYMGDLDFFDGTPFEPAIIMEIYPNEMRGTTTSRVDLLRPYNIELIEWELSNPIVNNFK